MKGVVKKEDMLGVWSGKRARCGRGWRQSLGFLPPGGVRGPSSLLTLRTLGLCGQKSEPRVLVPFSAPRTSNLGPEENPHLHTPSTLSPGNVKVFEVSLGAKSPSGKEIKAVLHYL